MSKKEEIAVRIDDNIEIITSNRGAIEEIKSHLQKYGITGGYVERVLSHTDTLFDTDIREVFLLLEQFYLKTGLEELNPNNWFTEYEEKEARQYNKTLIQKKKSDSLIVFEDVNIVGDNIYSAVISPSRISEMMKRQELYYNQDIQRQPKFIKQNDNIIPVPTVYKQNVKEIKDLLVNQALVSTTIALNAAVDTGDDGRELSYDAATRTLTVEPGARLDILDGYHRCLGSEEAVSTGADLGKFQFMLRLSNLTTIEAQQFQAQLAKSTPIPKSRQKELAQDRHADRVVRILRNNSELEGRVSSNHQLSTQRGELVSSGVLSDAIEREFPMKYRIDEVEISEYLSTFFNHLIGKNREEFSHNKNTEKSLMSYNKMFAGYIALAAKMKENNIKIDELQKIIESIDFSRSNILWLELGLVDEKGVVRGNVREKRIADYFKNMVAVSVD